MAFDLEVLDTAGVNQNLHMFPPAMVGFDGGPFVRGAKGD